MYYLSPVLLFDETWESWNIHTILFNAYTCIIKCDFSHIYQNRNLNRRNAQIIFMDLKKKKILPNNRLSLRFMDSKLR